MPITTNASYLTTMDEFSVHWLHGNTLLTTGFIIRLPDDTTRTLLQFDSMRNGLQVRQSTVQAKLTATQIARAALATEKQGMLAKLNLFIGAMDSHYQNTSFYVARPYAPGVAAGRDAFLRPLEDALELWALLNEGPAPQGVTLPLVLVDGTDVEEFQEDYTSLLAAYKLLQSRELAVKLARGERNKAQEICYAAMKAYRESVPTAFVAFPVFVDSMPRLTPLPGHTPQAVNASAVFVAPNQARVVYDASTDALLERYELRGTVGEVYDEEDAVVLDTHTPGDAREFVTAFGLNQPGAEIALKVFVILTTGNEAGSAAMQVERPSNLELLAA